MGLPENRVQRVLETLLSDSAASECCSTAAFTSYCHHADMGAISRAFLVLDAIHLLGYNEMLLC